MDSRVTSRQVSEEASPAELMATTVYVPASSGAALLMTSVQRSPWNSSWEFLDSFTGRSPWYQITCGGGGQLRVRRSDEDQRKVR